MRTPCLLQVAPQDAEVELAEMGLRVVTDPMKSVTKLGRASANQQPNGNGLPLMPPPLTNGGGYGNGHGEEGLKRKYGALIEEQAMQLQTLQATQTEILRELQSLVSIANGNGLMPTTNGMSLRGHGAGASG